MRKFNYLAVFIMVSCTKFFFLPRLQEFVLKFLTETRPRRGCVNSDAAIVSNTLFAQAQKHDALIALLFTAASVCDFAKVSMKLLATTSHEAL